MKFQRHTLQLLPGRQHRSYAGAAVVVLHAAALFPAALALDLMGRRAVLGHAAGHAHPAVAESWVSTETPEELPIS